MGKDRLWAQQNYLSQRSLQHASSVRAQLTTLLDKLGVDVSLSCRPQKEPLLKAIATGLFFNAARLVIGKSDVVNVNDSKVALPNFKASSKFSDRYNSTNKKVLLSSSASSAGGDSVDASAPYRTIKGGQPVHIHPSSVLFSGSARSLPSHVVYSELLITSKKYMRGVTVVDGSWLIQLAPSSKQDTDDISSVQKT